jgi:hypothetical protein
MALTEFELINGLTCLSIVLVFAIISIIIISKYFKSRERIYILFGISWFFVAEAWISPSIVFLMILISGKSWLTFELYAIIAISGYPFTVVVWLAALTDFGWKEKQKILMLTVFILGVVFEIFFLYMVFTEPSQVGEFYGAVDAHYALFIQIYFIILMVYFLITGLLFARLSLKSDVPEIQLRGKVLIIAFIMFIIGGFIDNIQNFNVPLLILGRVILILAGIFFYLAFILPNWLKKLFLE